MVAGLQDKFTEVAKSDVQVINLVVYHGDSKIDLEIQIQMMRSLRAENPNAKLALFWEDNPLGKVTVGQEQVPAQQAIDRYMKSGNVADIPAKLRPERKALLDEARALNFQVLCIDDENVCAEQNVIIDRLMQFNSDNKVILRNFRDPQFMEFDAKRDQILRDYADLVDKTHQPRNETIGRRQAEMMQGTNKETYYINLPSGGFDKAISVGGSKHYYNANDIDEIAAKHGLKKSITIESEYIDGNQTLIFSDQKSMPKREPEAVDLPEILINTFQAGKLGNLPPPVFQQKPQQADRTEGR